MREFIKNKHELLVISPYEIYLKGSNEELYIENSKIIKVKIGKFQKTNVVVKAINMFLLNGRILRKLNKNDYSNTDLIIYATPPIVFEKNSEVY